MLVATVALVVQVSRRLNIYSIFGECLKGAVTCDIKVSFTLESDLIIT